MYTNANHIQNQDQGIFPRKKKWENNVDAENRYKHTSQMMLTSPTCGFMGALLNNKCIASTLRAIMSPGHKISQAYPP